MFVRASTAEWSWETSSYAYIFDQSQWSDRQLVGLAYAENERKTDNIDRNALAITGGIFGSVLLLVSIIVLFGGGGWAALIPAAFLAACIWMCAPQTISEAHKAAHNKATKNMQDRSRAVVVTNKKFEPGYNSSSYAVQALLKTPFGKTFRSLLKDESIRGGKQMKAALKQPVSEGLLAMIKPDLDEYFASTALMDTELELARKQNAHADAIRKTEAAIDRYAATVSMRLQEFVAAHEAGIRFRKDAEQRLDDTHRQIASDKLLALTQAFDEVMNNASSKQLG